MGRPNVFHVSGVARGVETIALPQLEFVRRAPLAVADAGVRMLRLFRLRWPGEDVGAVGEYDKLAASLARRHWHDVPAEPRFVSLQQLVTSNQRRPSLLPRDVAYHLAVNRHAYYPDGVFVDAVWALPSWVVNGVLDEEFLVDDTRVTVLESLRWLVMMASHTPWYSLGRRPGAGAAFRGLEFVRDGVYSLIQAYFRLLHDCRYDSTTKFWRGGSAWWRAAAALLLTRYASGPQVYTWAGMYEPADGVWSAAGRRAAFAEMPDMESRLAAWHAEALWDRDETNEVEEG